jgi:hypothetical protein
MPPSTLTDASLGQRWAMRLAVVFLVAVSAGLAALGNGSPVLPLLPAAALFVLWGTLRLPLGWIACAALFIALACDNPGERPGMGLYKSVLYPGGELLYLALEKTLRVPGLKMFGIEVLLFGLAALAWWRRPRGARLPRELRVACGVTVGAILLLWIYGIGTGGSVRFSMLQVRPLLFMALWPLVFAAMVGPRRFVPAALGTVVAVAVLRSAIGLYYWATILRFGIHGPISIGGGSYVTTHSDSVLSAAALLVLAAWLLVRPSLRGVVVTLLTAPVIVAGLAVNNRRLAYVAIAMAVVVLYPILTVALRRRVNRVLLFLLPFLAAYFVAAWGSPASWAKPVTVLRTVLTSEDASAQTRDIENWNLVRTAKRNPLIGIGMGKPYDEHVAAYTISDKFEAYLYVPHNSLLWLLAAGGVVGLALIWLPQFVAALLAAWLLRRTRRDDERVLALVTLGYVVAYGVQAFGDMGIGSWMGALILGALLGLVAVAVARTNAEAAVAAERDARESA